MNNLQTILKKKYDFFVFNLNLTSGKRLYQQRFLRP